ncbi:hypothetical protein Chor_013978 [Crotalus horridus]
MKEANFVKCSQVNSLCGKIHCTSFKHENLPSQLYFQNLDGVSCVSTEFNLGSDIPDPALVHKGTSCAEGKACIDYRCVNASLLGYNCDIKKKCNGRAVCNNKGNCHCDPGWAPPFYTSLRDGLLIFFLLVLPILILLAIAFVKRKEIKRRLFRERRRQKRTENAQQRRPLPAHQNNTPSKPNPPEPINRKRATSTKSICSTSTTTSCTTTNITKASFKTANSTKSSFKTANSTKPSFKTTNSTKRSFKTTNPTKTRFLSSILKNYDEMYCTLLGKNAVLVK